MTASLLPADGNIWTSLPPSPPPQNPFLMGKKAISSVPCTFLIIIVTEVARRPFPPVQPEPHSLPRSDLYQGDAKEGPPAAPDSDVTRACARA